jgi:hypothetical protein
MMKLWTTAQLRDEAEHCRRLAGGKSDPLTTKLLAALAEIYATEVVKSVSNRLQSQRRVTFAFA